MVKLIFLAAILFCSQAKADFVDDVGGDKQAHFIGGAIITASLYTFTPLTIKQSLTVGILAGLAKEVMDRRTTGFNMRDFAATAAGSGAVFFYHKWRF